MPYDLSVPGFFPEHHLKIIERIAENVPENAHIVELGSLYGRSALAWALSTPPSVSITCIDEWANKALPESLRLDLINGDIRRDEHLSPYERFVANTREFSNIYSIVGDSTSVMLKDCDLVFIDAAHNYDAVWAELQHWSLCVKESGLLCGHDFSPAPHLLGTARAVMMFARQQKMHVFVPAGTTIWMLVRSLNHLKDWYTD
jgi:hypothetical protein